MEKYIMALDQGTTSSRCIIFNKNGEIVSSAAREFTQIYKQAGWVEHDPNEIWGSQIGAAHEALAKARIKPEDIACMGITNQRETVILWDKSTGRPVYNAIVWQCRRTAELCDKLRQGGFETGVREKTGLLLDPYFSATKIKWILDNVNEAQALLQKGNLLFGTVDTWLIWNLTAGREHLTDHSNASRTLLFNIHTKKWDEELIKLFGVPQEILPEIRYSGSRFANTAKEIFGAEIPIGGTAGDQQAALFGQLCFKAGMAKNTYGTGCFLLMNMGEKYVESENGLLTTLTASYNSTFNYALEGSIFIGGAIIKWLRDELELIRHAEETEQLAKSVADNNGVYIVPAFVGLGAPYWDAHARGIISGLTRGAGKAHIARAALESMAYQSYDVLHAMQEDSGITLSSLNVDGGACANNFLLQFQADILNSPVLRPPVTETTALGAAYLAGLSAGYWDNMDELSRNLRPGTEFIPDMPQEKRGEYLKQWHAAVRQAMTKED